jgi:hypothetical protein
MSSDQHHPETRGKRRRGRLPSPYRAALATYIQDKKHVLSPLRAKAIAHIAQEVGMSAATVRHWLKVDHFEEWVNWWLPMSLIPIPVDWDGGRNDFLDELPEADPQTIAALAEDDY